MMTVKRKLQGDFKDEIVQDQEFLRRLNIRY